MIIQATKCEVEAILRAMKTVAEVGGNKPLTRTDRTALRAAAHFLFRWDDEFDADALAIISPDVLAQALSTKKLRDHTVQFLTVMVFVDAALDESKFRIVTGFATKLNVRGDYLDEIAAACQGRVKWAIADMLRHNAESIAGTPWAGDDFLDWALPYRGDKDDPDLAARYRALESMPLGTLGHAFWRHYSKNGYAFPGEQKGVTEVFGKPHDSIHILSGYNTSFKGEILTSAFTAGMHPVEPMAGHVLPQLFGWQVGFTITEYSSHRTGEMDVEHFWEAWERGSETNVDVFDKRWDFWSAIEQPVKQLRLDYGIPPKE